MKKNIAFILMVIFPGIILFAQVNTKVPSFEEVLSLKGGGTPIISPDGKHIVFTVRQTDWENNRNDAEIWISKNGSKPFQLTNNPEANSSNPKWSPDGNWIAFASVRGNKNQIYVIRAEGGEAFPVTRVDQGVGGFEWSPDGERIAFTIQEQEEKTEKAREERYGKYAVEDAEYHLTRIWAIDFDPDSLEFFPLPCNEKDSARKADLCQQWPEPSPLIDSVEYTVTGFEWSPDGKMIAFNHQPDPLINTFFKSDISILKVDTKEILPLVNNPSYDGFIAWSPDSRSILYSSSVD